MISLPPQQPLKPSQSMTRSNVAAGPWMTKPPPEELTASIKQPRAVTNKIFITSIWLWGSWQPPPWTHVIRMAQRSSYRHLVHWRYTRSQKGGKGMPCPHDKSFRLDSLLLWEPPAAPKLAPPATLRPSERSWGQFLFETLHWKCA